MSRITTPHNAVTVINVFAVEPHSQQPLVDLLTRATDETFRRLPGFMSANIHKSLDGVRVASCAQWQSREDFDAMLSHPAAMPRLKAAAALARSSDVHLYDTPDTRAIVTRPASLASRAAAVGALALGACAVGAFAVGRLAIGALAVRRGSVRTLSIDDVAIRRLTVQDLTVGP